MTVLTLKLDAIFFQGIVYRKQIKAEEFMIVTLNIFIATIIPM